MSSDGCISMIGLWSGHFHFFRCISADVHFRIRSSRTCRDVCFMNIPLFSVVKCEYGTALTCFKDSV